MDCVWAARMLDNGKKIRLQTWFKGNYISVENGEIVDSCGEIWQWDNDFILFNTWELFEEPEQTLSDNIQTIHSTDSNDKCVINCNEWCKVEDIKKSINRIKEGIGKLNYHRDCIDEVSELIDEVTGPRFNDQ